MITCKLLHRPGKRPVNGERSSCSSVAARPRIGPRAATTGGAARKLPNDLPYAKESAIQQARHRMRSSTEAIKTGE